MASMAELPLGCKFSPSDEEIFTYLDNKVNDLKQPNVKLDLVKELDLYQSCPEDHQGLSKEECTYVFTTRVAKSQCGRINDRKTKDGKGTWLFSSSKKLKLGTKNTLTYHPKGGKRRGKKDWIMHEYALRPADPEMNVKETKVLCRIYNRNQKHELTDTKQESDSSPKDGTGQDKSGLKLMMSKSSQEYQQNTAAPANEEIVCTNLCPDGNESSQEYQKNTAAPANEEIVCTNLCPDGDESRQEYQKNTAAPANEETVWTNLCPDGDEPSQEYQQTAAPANEEIVWTNLCPDGDEPIRGYDPHENTTSTAKNGLDLSLKL